MSEHARTGNSEVRSTGLFGAYQPIGGGRQWYWGRKVRAKVDITTKSGLVVKAGDETTISQNDPFEGSTYYHGFVTVWATQGFMRGYQVSVRKGEVEFAE